MSEPVDGAARRHAITAPGSVLVQAPAGSGKTTLLAQRYLRLLSASDGPERILALTFTRRAAQEMRERVLQALHAAALPSCPTTMNGETWALGVAAKRHMDALGLDLERHPSRLRIETIDAFNSWLAGQLPITAGSGARLDLVEKAKPLYDEAARRALAHEEPDAFGQAVDRVLELDDQRWRSLVKLVSGMLGSRDRWLPLLAGHLGVTGLLDAGQLRRVRRQMDEDLELLVTRCLSAAHEVLQAEKLAALSCMVHAAAKRLEAPSAEMTAWQGDASTLTAGVRDLSRWRAAAAALLTKDGAYRRSLTKNEGFPPKCADKAVMLDLIAELERKPAVLRTLLEIRGLPDPAYDHEQWGRVREVAQVMVLAAAQLEQVFREVGTVDFPAVSMAALRALGDALAPTDLSLRLDYRLQHILVDEFQDTSSAQLELVKLLTAGWQSGDGRSVFCVGDPMQSIYGFRQAEVRAFLELAEEGMGDVRFDVERLRSNFRSAPPLVQWINATFSQVLPRVDDRERGAIAFRPSDAAMPVSAADDAAVTLRGLASRRMEADAVAAAIAQAAAQHPHWRIVVLVRAKSHARDIAQALRTAGIAFRAVDIEPLQDRPAVRDLVMLICALLHRADRTAWLALLRAPWVGLTLDDLLHVARASPVPWEALNDDTVLAGLSADGRARCHGLRRTLQAAFEVRTRGSVTRWVEQAWLALGGASRVASPDEFDHVSAVFGRLRQLEEQGLPDAAELADSFADLFAEYRAPAAVEIMTIHKSKGLEFDMVVVPALDRHIPGNRDQLLLSHEFARAGRDGLVMAARPGVGMPTDRLFEFLRYQQRDAAGLEADRLLYVACTRAKWRLLLTATVRPDDAPDTAVVSEASALEAGTADRAPFKPRAGSLLAVLWPVRGAEFALADGHAPKAEPPRAPRGGPIHRVPTGWVPATAEVLSAGDALATHEAREPTPVFDWAGETARRVGSLVHAELQFLDLERHDEAAIAARATHHRRWLELHGVPADRVAAAGERVLAALLAVHRDARGRWMLKRGYRDDVREHALSARWQGRVVRVVFDRSFIDEQGVRWVIDYKTSHHGGGNLEEFLAREVERYAPQLHRYAQVARRLGPELVRVGLYFPLLGAWREWEPEI